MVAMSLSAILLAVFIVSLTTSLVAARFLSRVNVKGRHPERSRHWSESGIPRIGGVAVFIAAPIAIVFTTLAAARVFGGALRLPELAGSLIVGSAILFTIGLLDDLRGVRPLVKLLAQTAAALIIYGAGLSIENLSLFPGHAIHLGVFALPVTILWLVGISNAFNLVDGLDGLAGGVAIIALIAIAPVGLVLHNVSVAVYAVALVGALLGFLKYNWPTARLFMGDSGSLVVGFLLAVLTVRGATDSAKVTHALIPIFALAYPLFDTGIAILRRWLRGVPLSRADLRHVHHQLGAMGLSPRKSLGIIYLTSAFLACLGLVATFAPPAVTVLATLGGVAGLFLVIALGIYWLEYHEFVEAGASLASAARRGRTVIQDRINARDLAQMILRAESVDEVQALLDDSADSFRFEYMRLSDLQSRTKTPGRITRELQAVKLWKLEYPIVHGKPQEYDGLCLTIWCALEVPQRPAGAERIAKIIGPAIAEWARDGRLQKPTDAAVERFIAARENGNELDGLSVDDGLVPSLSLDEPPQLEA
jgi:UDP-GlcNAc:undecaprenyl-phosphate GlcNAc-1-phosphate transferase